MEKAIEVLTVKEALEQGYERCGYSRTEFQSLLMIDKLDAIDFEYGELLVADKEPSYATLEPLEIMNLAIGAIMETEVASMDDTDSLPDKLRREIDWEEIAGKINAASKTYLYWYLTTIRLIPNP